jgi:hypothetical protein
MKNAVFGFATNMSRTPILSFCRSIRAVYDPADCDIVIFTNNTEEYYEELEALSVCVVRTNNTYQKYASWKSRLARRSAFVGVAFLKKFVGDGTAPELNRMHTLLLETWLHPHIARWVSYSNVIDVRRYRQIFFSDVKDVIVQAEFFKKHNPDRLYFFEESSVYGKSTFNDNNYVRAYGREFLDSIVGTVPICLGTVIAGGNAARALTDAVIASLRAHPFIGSDQVRVNHAIVNGLIDATIRKEPNISGAVATLNLEARDKVVVEDGFIRRVTDGSIVPIVHMYTRYDDLARFVHEKYVPDRQR